MLSIGAMAAGQHEYYTGLASADDYYVSGQEPPGMWWGVGAEMLGCYDRVQTEALKSMCEGFSPLGEMLKQNSGQANLVPGWDLTFSAPKSVSVLWSQADKGSRQVIEEAHSVALKRALSWLENNAAFCRVGKGGVESEAAKLAVACFQHSTNRNQEPNLHTHCLVLNVGITADGKSRALNSTLLYQNKMLAGAIYRCQLSYELETRLGLECNRVKSWFELAGVSKSLCESFSSRRQEILEHLRAVGLESAEAASVAVLATRQVKQNIRREDLFATWHQEGETHGFGALQVQDLFGRSPDRDQAGEFREAFDAAVTRLGKAQSHFSYREILRAVAEESQGRGLDSDQVITRLATELENNHEIVRLGSRDGELRYTTREMLELEKSLLAAIEMSKGNASHIASPESVGAVLQNRGTITEEQALGLLHLTRRGGSVQCLTGMAGTGKSFLMDAAREVWESDGYRVLGAALAGKAAQGLMEGSGIRSTTIHKIIHNLDNDWLTLGPKDVLVVDESGTVPTWMMERLVRETSDAGAKLVCVGDSKQLQPIEAGAPFQAMCVRVGNAKLTQIIRQRDEWAREAVQDFAAGDAKQGLERYAERGLLHVAKDRNEAMRALVKEYKDDGLDTGRVAEKLILAGTNYEVSCLNAMVQEERRKGGELGACTKVDNSTIHVGDRVVFTKRSTMLGLENGSFGIVAALSEKNSTLTVRLDTGKFVLVPLVHYSSVRLGYAVTDFKAQGATVERAYVLTGGQMTHREASYVETSRAREFTCLFTDRNEAGDELERLAKQMSKSRAKDLAHDILKGPELELSPQL